MFGFKRKVIALMGTSGNSTWRQDIAIPLIERVGKKYYNPQKSDWIEDDIKVEYDHLINDKIIVHVITQETGGFGSLAESGWIALGAILGNQKVGFYIELNLIDAVLHPDERRARKLIIDHMTKLKHKNIYLASSIQDLIEWAIRQV